MDSDPGDLRGRIELATTRLLTTAAALTNGQARAPSLLPGWSRGHVLTHLARNADGLRNLLIWARTGVPTPMYPSRQARDEAIEAGSGRSASELAADLRAAAQAFLAAAGGMSGEAWQMSVGGIGRPAHPAWVTLWRRLSEVEIHHVDLDAGYRPADWPDSFITDCLEVVADVFTGIAQAPPTLLSDTGTGRTYRIGPAEDAGPAEAAGDAGAAGAAGPRVSVTGPGHDLLAWLTGRSAGAQLTAEPPGALPALPAW